MQVTKYLFRYAQDKEGAAIFLCQSTPMINSSTILLTHFKLTTIHGEKTTRTHRDPTTPRP